MKMTREEEKAFDDLLAEKLPWRKRWGWAEWLILAVFIWGIFPLW